MAESDAADSKTLKEFAEQWKEKFAEEPLPRLTCFEGNENDATAKRKGVQVLLDYHNIRVTDLQKKLLKEQFLMEFLAQELEKMPVPRQSSATPPAADKPVPSPRSRRAPPPPTAKKPSIKISGDSTGGVIRRNKSTPSARHGAGVVDRQQFRSVIIPSNNSLEEVSPTEEHEHIQIKTPVLTPSNSIIEDDTERSNDRFKSFQGSTFGGKSPQPPSQICQRDSINTQSSSPLTVSETSTIDDTPTETPESTLNSSPSVIVEKRSDSFDDDIIAAPTPSRVARNSMKNMDRISIQESMSTDSDSSADSTSDYMHLWDINKPQEDVKRSSSSVSNNSISQTAAENPDDTSAASIKSSSGAPARKKGSRMVMVDYSNKNGGPQPIRDPDADNQDDTYNSDEEDDKPQYIRLMYKSCYNNFGRQYHIDSVSTHSNDSTDSPPSANTNSLSAKYRYKGPQRHTMFYDSDWSLESIESKQRGFSEGDNDLATRPPLQTDESQDEQTQGTEPDNESLKMRNWVVNSVLESEKSYIDDLNVLLKYKKSLEMAAQTSVPLITIPDVNSIFGNLQQIHGIHSSFRQELEPIIAKWTHHSEVGHLFKEMAVNLEHYNTYLENYPNAIATVKKCCTENNAFNDLVKNIKCPSAEEMMHLEAILHKPINRMQRNSLLLQDMLQCTPPSHPDHKMFQNALKLSQHFLRDQMKISSTGNDKVPLHVLVKNQLMVELVRGKARKLRHVFLFNDIIICTKCVIVKGKQQYDVKWFVPLSEVQLSDKMDDTPVEWKQRVAKAEKEIQAMKSKLKDLKAQLRKAIKECKEKDVEIGSNAKIQRLNKTIQEQESYLILAEPRLRFTISTKKGIQFCFLLPSDYERREWQESIQTLKTKTLSADEKPKITLLEAQSIVDTCKDNVHLNNMGQMVMKEASDEDIVSGQLTVTIHKILGLQNSCETFTAIEVDSFGHFYLKAKTPLKTSDSPTWNESFAIDLESSSTLRMICYKRTNSGDEMLGKSSLKLSKQWLKQGFQEKELSMNEVTLTVSIKYKTADQTIRRLPSRIESGIFGVKLSSTCNKEGLKVPAFVSACIEEVEKRGLDEMGIYRVSGTTSDVQRIRKAFDKSARVGKTLLPEVDINAVTGALKYYFRELPEAVITDALYPELVETYKMQDKEEQEKKMISLLNSLPDSNYHTMMAILEHLIRIRNHEASNKMPFHNLAVVFGPTLLKPAEKAQAANPMDLFSSSANDAMYQSGILFYYLTLLSKGTQFR